MRDVYPALRLVTGQYVTPSELDSMCLDDVDDLNIILAAEAEARERHRKAHTP